MALLVAHPHHDIVIGVDSLGKGERAQRGGREKRSAEETMPAAMYYPCCGMRVG